MSSLKATVIATLMTVAAARSVPQNIQSFYNTIRAQGQCNDKLASGFYSKENDGGKSSYCGDHLKDFNVIYLQSQDGNLVNMDTDCDGIQNASFNDGRCSSSTDTQSQTTFSDTVKGYGTGLTDLDPNIHPYVVFGNSGSKPGWKQFDPTAYGIEPLSVIAVVCGNQVVYGIWWDTNGDDGPQPMVGEASIAVATACYGKDNINGNQGHDPDDVLYIAFPGKDAVPGARGARWNASSYSEFEASIVLLGDNLLQRIGRGNSTSTGAAHPTHATPSRPSVPTNTGNISGAVSNIIPGLVSLLTIPVLSMALQSLP